MRLVLHMRPIYQWTRRRRAYHCFSNRVSYRRRGVLAVWMQKRVNVLEVAFRDSGMHTHNSGCANVMKYKHEWENGLAGCSVLCICTNPGIFVLPSSVQICHFTVFKHSWRHFERKLWSWVTTFIMGYNFLSKTHALFGLCRMIRSVSASTLPSSIESHMFPSSY